MRLDELTGGGDRQSAVAALYESCSDRVVRYIAARIGDKDQAQELAGDVFLRALLAIDSYEDTGRPLEAWLFRIAHNVTVDHLRKQERRKPAVPLDAAGLIAAEESLSDRLEEREEMEEVRSALLSLTPLQREVIALRFGAGMRSDEIAGVLGKSSGAVRWLQHAAIQRLRKLLHAG
jgi:RNA polymerase sigma-70 factor (ECF subfamily)